MVTCSVVPGRARMHGLEFYEALDILGITSNIPSRSQELLMGHLHRLDSLKYHKLASKRADRLKLLWISVDLDQGDEQISVGKGDV